MFLKNLQCSHRKTAVLESLWNNATGLKVHNFNSNLFCNLISKVLSCGEYCQIFKSSFFIEYLLWLFLKMSYSTPPQVFLLLKWMSMKFSIFLLSEVYSSMVIHGQYIFITYDSVGRERKNLQQLIKITNLTKIKQKFISTTWPQ